MKIEILRKTRGLSQKALAKKAGISQATVHYAETGGNTTQKTLQKIATALGVSIVELLDRSLPKMGKHTNSFTNNDKKYT